MSKDYTLEKLSQYESLIEKVKSKNLYDKWFGYKSSNLHDNNVLIEFSDFEFIEKENNIRFPSYIKLFYSNIGCKESDFHYQVKRMNTDKNQGLLEYQYSEEFATKIVQEYFESSVDKKEDINKEIRFVDNNKALASYENDLCFLLWEGLEFYNKKENYFSISFLQKIYADLNSNFDLIIENFFTWCHCGGAGGIVLNSFRKGYDGGEQWGEGLTISYKGKEFDYKSNYHQRRLNFHLDKFIDNIECENKNIEQFLHDN